MTTDWRTVRIDELKADAPNSLTTGPFGSAISSRFFTASGVPVIRGSNLSHAVGARLVEEDVAFVSQEKARELRRSLARRGDLVFTCWGTVGQVGLIDERSGYDEYVISNKQMKLTPDPNQADSLFLYYLFSSPQFVGQVKAEAIGSSVPGFNLGQLRSFRVALPPLEEQRAIAAVLGALDDKVELNRRMNRTLEDAVRAVFSARFDSAPVSGRVGDVSRNIREGADPAAMPPETPYIGLEHMPQRSLALGEWESVQKVTSTKLAFRRGDILFGKLRPYFHKVGVAPVDGVCSSDILVIRAGDDAFYGWLIWMLSEASVIDHATAVSSGTRMPRVKWEDIAQLEVHVPERRTACEFNELANPAIEMMTANVHQARTLAAMRDLLLPRLISGELRVRDAESLVEAAT